jgi:hypothetical protein
LKFDEDYDRGGSGDLWKLFRRVFGNGFVQRGHHGIGMYLVKITKNL